MKLQVLARFALGILLTTAAHSSAHATSHRSAHAAAPTTGHFTELEHKLAYLANDDIDVVSYDLILTVPKIDAAQIAAHLTLKIKSLRRASTISLHFESAALTIHKLQEGGQDVPFAIKQGAAVPAHDLGGQVLRIERPGFNAGTTATLEIDYEIKVQSRMEGLFFEANFNGTHVLSTRSWPYYARYWLPSNDHPSDTATFSVEAHVAKSLQVAANGELEGGNDLLGSGLDAAGLRVFKWRQTTPIPTYGFNVVISTFDVNKQNLCFDLPQSLAVGSVKTATKTSCARAEHKLPQIYYAPRGFVNASEFQKAVDLAAQAAVFYSGALGLYPYSKLGFVTAPHPFNMEHPSLITIVSSDSAVHEVLHHWWGDTVHIKHWGDFWISEGFTTYFTGLYDEVVTGTNTACTATLGRLNNPESTDPLDIFDDVAYCKGSAALADLRERLAKAAGPALTLEQSRTLFLSVARDLFTEFRFKQLGTNELVKYLQNNLQRLLTRSGYPVEDLVVRQLVIDWQARWFDRSLPL